MNDAPNHVCVWKMSKILQRFVYCISISFMENVDTLCRTDAEHWGQNIHTSNEHLILPFLSHDHEIVIPHLRLRTDRIT